MNYIEWAEEYYQNALRIKSVIEKKKGMLNEKISADTRQKLIDDIRAYRNIYYDLTRIGDTLLERAGRKPHEA